MLGLEGPKEQEVPLQSPHQGFALLHPSHGLGHGADLGLGPFHAGLGGHQDHGHPRPLQLLHHLLGPHILPPDHQGGLEGKNPLGGEAELVAHAGKPLGLGRVVAGVVPAHHLLPHPQGEEDLGGDPVQADDALHGAHLHHLPPGVHDPIGLGRGQGAEDP